MNKVYKQWEQKRSELNHRWLSNNYIQRLDSFKDYLCTLNNSDKQQYRHRLSSIYIEIIPQWKENKYHIMDLINRASEELSPSNYFNYLPLTNADDCNKIWLKEIIHCLWLNKFNVTDLMESSRIVCMEANNNYYKFINVFESFNFFHDEMPADGYNVTDNFLNSCNKLKNKLSEFSKIQRVI